MTAQEGRRESLLGALLILITLDARVNTTVGWLFPLYSHWVQIFCGNSDNSDSLAL